jgi:BlaI family transcriptional regulator, penicillinase repressor
MAIPKLSRAELKVIEALWTKGASSIREIQETLPAKNRPAYTTVQTLVYRLEAKGAVRRTKKIGGAHIFEATISRHAAQRRLVDELLALFGGRAQPLMSHLVETGKVTLDDIEEAKRVLEKAAKKDGRP